MLLLEMLGHRLAAWLEGVSILVADDYAFESIHVETESSEPPLEIVFGQTFPTRSFRRESGDRVGHA